MSKILINITTCNDNFDYFKESATRLFNNDTDHKFVILVTDYSYEIGLVYQFYKDFQNTDNKRLVYVNRPLWGFANNINFTFAYGYLLDVDYIGHINDDVLVQPDFVNKMIDSIKDVDFVCGVQQECDEAVISLSDLLNMPFPDPINKTEYVDMRGKWGDYSAFLGKADSISKVGKLDENYGPVGILADNDYTLRLLKQGLKFKRDYSIRFLHGKGVTQRQYREGFPNDEVLVKSRALFIKKWGIDVYWGDINDSFPYPYNVKHDRAGISQTVYEEYNIGS